MAHYPSHATATDAVRDPQTPQAFQVPVVRGVEVECVKREWHADGKVARWECCGGVVE